MKPRSDVFPAELEVGPPLYDNQTSFEIYKMQFKVAGETYCNWDNRKKATALVLAPALTSA